MLGCNQDITLWIRDRNKDRESETGKYKEVFTRYVLPVRCRWINCVERDISGGTVNIYKKVVIIIPYFEGLVDLNIKNGDIAALGDCRIDIGVDEVGEVDEIEGNMMLTSSELKQFLMPDIMTIKSLEYNIDDMRGKHLRLTGN